MKKKEKNTLKKKHRLFTKMRFIYKKLRFGEASEKYTFTAA